MIYKKTVEGIFIERPNRFIALVLIQGVQETVHVKNTGRCRELLIPGAKVILEDCSLNPNRKTKYSIIAIYKDSILINMDSQVPNAVVFEALNGNKIIGFEDLKCLKREVTYGNSRFDIYYESQNKKGFIEVKGVTLEANGIAMFPDAPTERGTKHVLEMIEAVKQGYSGAILFLIQMENPFEFKLNWKIDKKFSEAVHLASENDVEILAYDSIVGNNCIYIGESVNIDLNNKS